jgi:ribosome-binding protein aMBF1 (putative translation factor)
MRLANSLKTGNRNAMGNITSQNLIEFRKLLGKKITEIRESRGLAVEEVSIRTGIKPDAIRSIELGRWNIDLETIFRLKETLEFDLVLEMY